MPPNFGYSVTPRLHFGYTSVTAKTRASSTVTPFSSKFCMYTREENVYTKKSCKHFFKILLEKCCNCCNQVTTGILAVTEV